MSSNNMSPDTDGRLSESMTLNNTPSDSSADIASHGSVRPNTPGPGGTSNRNDLPISKLSTEVKEPSSAPSVDIEPDWPRERQAWITLFGGFLLMFNSWGLVNAYGTYQSFYFQHLTPNVKLTDLNFIGSTQCFVVLFCALPVGRLLDAGYARQLTFTGATLISLSSFFLAAFAVGSGNYNEGKYWAIWAIQGLMQGLGMGCFFVPSSAIVATWFHKRKSLAVGIVASGASIAGLIYPIMLKFLIAKHGFRNAQLAVAGLTTGTAFLASYCAKPNPKQILHHPHDTGRTWGDWHVWIDPEAFKDRAWCWFSASIAFLFLGFYAVFFNLEEWAAAKGFGRKDQVPAAVGGITVPQGEVNHDAIRVFYLLAIMNGSSTVGRITSAKFSDRLGTIVIHLSTNGICSVLLLAWWPNIKNHWAALAYVIVFGMFSGAVIGLPPASMAEILGRSDPHRQKMLGHWTGMMYNSASWFALGGPPLVGLVLERTGKNWLALQLWTGSCLFVSFACMVMARLYMNKRRRQEKHQDVDPSEAPGSFEKADELEDATASPVTTPTSTMVSNATKEKLGRSGG